LFWIPTPVRSPFLDGRGAARARDGVAGRGGKGLTGVVA
jgi:hypothetical protein